ncbi:hypothetical protein D3C76_1291090 [compost metagenome]
MRITDVGIGMLMSLASALLLMFTLLWGLMGIIEFRILLKAYKNTKNKLSNGEINKGNYGTELRRHKYNLTINIAYLIMMMIQLGYVIYNWDELNL